MTTALLAGAGIAAWPPPPCSAGLDVEVVERVGGPDRAVPGSSRPAPPPGPGRLGVNVDPP